MSTPSMATDSSVSCFCLLPTVSSNAFESNEAMIAVAGLTHLPHRPHRAIVPSVAHAPIESTVPSSLDRQLIDFRFTLTDFLNFGYLGRSVRVSDCSLNQT